MSNYKIPVLNNLRLSDTEFYHGGPIKLSILQPHVSTHQINAVYVTPSYTFALCYAGEQWDDLVINQTIYNGNIYMTELVPGYFKKCFDRVGYIHVVDRTSNFKPLNGGWKEYVHEGAVPVRNVITIPNVLAELRNIGVKLYTYPSLPPFIKDRDEYIRTHTYELFKMVKDPKILEDARRIHPSAFSDEILPSKKPLPPITVKSKDSINPNDNLSKKAVDLTFYNDKHIEIGQASVSSIDTDNAFIYNLEVVPKYRGQGYGKAIMHYLLSNYRVGELTVTVDNKRAISLYKKFGFQEGVKFTEGNRRMLDMRIDPNKLAEYLIATESLMTSSVDPSFKAKGKRKLKEFERVPLTNELRNQYKKEMKMLYHTSPYKPPTVFSFLFFDEDNLVALLAMEYERDGLWWITDLQVAPAYRGYGLSKQLLDMATQEFSCTAIGVDKTNLLAKKIYEDYGFNLSLESVKEVENGKRNTYRLYL